MSFDLATTLRELIAIPSINPMGKSVEGPEYFEYRVTDYLERLFARFGIATVRQTIAPRRDNLIARIDGFPLPQDGGALLLLEAHQDTVPVTGMTIPPFDAQLRDGKVFGRGACDIKGGMTAMLAVMARLATERDRESGCESKKVVESNEARPPHPGPLPGGEGVQRAEMPTVVMACTVNEEHGFTGVSGLCKVLAENDASSASTIKSLLPRRPDAAIVAEPTNLNVVVAHKGAVRWRCHTRGKAVHSSQPELGENAIFRMAKVLAALEVYQRDVVGCLADHPRCGKPTLSVGTISGGLSVNTVPDRCTIEIDRRLAPGENPQAARKHVIDFVETQTAFGNYVEHDAPWLESRGLSDQHNGALAAKLSTAVWDAIGRKSEIKGVSFGTDAGIIAGSDIPAVVFGPGSIQQAHTADEWVLLAEVEQAAEALYRWVTDWNR